MSRRARPLAALLVVLTLAACGGDGDGDRDGAATTGGGAVSQFTLYYLEGEHVRSVPATVRDEAPTPAEALEALLTNDAGQPSAIPPGTRLHEVVVADGAAVVDLSPQFARGGGSASMQARVAQVVYTLTQWPWISRVTLEVDGEAVEAIGGEGVPARDLTREDVANALPPIFIDPPLVSATSPLTVAGSASVYEGTVTLRLEADGRTLSTGFATAAEGGPDRGDFEATLAFDVDEPTDATLVAFEGSAADGTEAKVVRTPVRLCPPGTTTGC